MTRKELQAIICEAIGDSSRVDPLLSAIEAAGVRLVPVKTVEENKRLTKLVRDLLENDPNEIVADGGHTVLDVWRYYARAALEETTDV